MMIATFTRVPALPHRPALPRISLGSEEATPRAQTIWAVLSLVVVTVLLAAAGVLYVHPPGYTTYHLALPEAGGLHGGEGVRVAGVPVGRVLGLRLRGDDVEIEFSMKSGVRLGDSTSVDVRMLTPVGGLYLAVLPAGAGPLRGAIPATRARLPFVVNDLVAAAKSETDKVDIDALRSSLSGAAAAVSGAPDALRGSVTDLQKVVELFATQRDRIRELVALSDEYVQAVRDNQAMAAEVLRAYALLGPQIVATRAKVKTFADATAAIVGTLFDFLSGPYATKVEPLLPPLEQTRDLGGQLLAETDRTMRALTETVTELGALAGPEGAALIDQSGLTVAAPNLCLPLPGKGC
ncbi:MlaD family protein [Nocardia sp. NPDC004068]|uniref:MlaD family protein n=1 Tax=Nocardia sp. NPDC004068 TaxID=3364303 RepID=UPI0036943724